MTDSSDPRSGTPAPPFRVQLIGPPRIFTPTGELSPGKPVVFGTALYLLLDRGRMVRRTELAALLWPDAHDAARGERMRWLVRQLKQHGFPLTARTPDITIAAADVAVDLEEAGRAATMQQALAHPCAAVLAAYEPDISDLFSHWLEERRSALQLELSRSVLPWLSTARRGGRWKETEQLARRVLMLDPHHAQAATALAESLAMQDTRPASASRPRAAGAPEDAGRSSRVAVLVGRGEVLQRLLAALGETHGASQRLAVAAPAGMGKSRLLHEFIALARLRGTEVASLRCGRGDTLRPLSLVIDLARTLLEARGAIGASPQSLEVLRRLIGANDQDDDDATPGDVRRTGVYSALEDLLAAVAEDHSLAVVVDDAQWAEPGSWAILSPMMAQRREAPVIWVTALRASTPGEATVLFEPISPSDDTGGEMLWLPPLEPASVSALCAARAAPGEIPPEVLARIIERAAGIPFVAEALVDHWLETGDVASLPSSIARMVRARLGRLSDTSRRVLAAVAVLGTDASPSAVEAAALLERPSLMGALHELDAAGMLRADAGLYGVHALWTEAIVGLVPAAAIQLMHRCAAEWLERTAPDGAESDARRAWATAEHWLAAGDAMSARGALDRAVNALSASGFHVEAARMMERAAEAAGASDAAMYYLERASELWLLDDSLQAIEAIASIRERYDTIGHRLHADDFSPHNQVELNARYAEMRRDPPLEDRLRPILDCVTAERATVGHRIFAAAHMMAYLKFAAPADLALFERAWNAIRALQPTSDEERRRLAGLGAMYHLVARGDAKRSRERLEPALAIVRRPDYSHAARRAYVIGHAADIAEAVGDLDEAQALRRESYASGKRLRHRLHVMLAVESLVQTSFEAGRTVEAREYLPILGRPVVPLRTHLDRARAIAWTVDALEEGDPARARTEFPVPLEEAERERALMPRARILAIYAHIALLEHDDPTIAALLPPLLECFVPRMFFMEHPAYVAAMCLERAAGWDAAATFVRRFVGEIRQERWTPRPELTRYLAAPTDASDPR